MAVFLGVYGGDSAYVVVKHLQKILSAAGLNPEPHGVPFTTESFRPAKCGISTIVFGPVDIAVAHAIDEKIAKDQLLLATDLLVRLATSNNWQKCDFLQ